MIHRREEWTEGEFRRRLGGGAGPGARAGYGRAGDAGQRQPGGASRAHGASYFRFITEPGVGPTNNLAEQAIRFVVIDRLITQGTRSDRGDRWCERIWTVMATCSQQGRSVFAYLEAAVTAWFAGEECRRCCRERADLRWRDWVGGSEGCKAREGRGVRGAIAAEGIHHERRAGDLPLGIAERGL